jgi:hypothetical protein
MGVDRYRMRLMTFAAILAVFTIGFPYILYGLVSLTSCRNVGGACGAVAVGIGVIGKPAGILVAIGGFFFIIWKRMPALGMSRLWNIATAIVLLGSIGTLVVFGNFWGANFVLGLIASEAFANIIVVAIFLVFLALDHDPDVIGAPEKDRWWRVLAVSLGYLALISAVSTVAWVTLMQSMMASGGSMASNPFGIVMRFLTLGLPVAMMSHIALAMFLIAIVMIALPSRGASSPPNAARPFPSPSPVASSGAPRQSFGLRRG